jgi:small-conductance mechanosensitive channel/CRP-like cAMP-binding protein
MFNALREFIQNFILFLQKPLLPIGDTRISISSIVLVLSLLLGIILFCRILKHFLKQFLLARLGIDEGNREAISTIISYAIGTFSFIFVLQTIRFPFTSLTVLAGALGVGIGFGLQSFSRDFIGGVTLLFERNIKVGDFVELGTEETFFGIKGTVKTISLRSATVRTRDGANLILPNSRLVERPVINWGAKTVCNRLILPIRVGRESNLVLVTEVLLSAAYLQAEVLVHPPPKVCFTGVQEDFFEFELHFWIEDMKEEEYIRSGLYFAIEYSFRNNEIFFQPTYQDMIIAFEKPEFIDPIATYHNRAWGARQSAQQQLHHVLPKRPKVQDLLKQSRYFEGFNELQIRQLLEAGYRQRLKPNEVLFHEDQPGDSFYIILDGLVEVFAERLGKQLAVLHPGQIFGELALMLGIPRSAMVRALEDTVVFGLDQQGFQKLLRDYPKFYELIMEGMEKRQEELAERQQEMRRMGLIDRVEEEVSPLEWARSRLRRLFMLT